MSHAKAILRMSLLFTGIALAAAGSITPACAQMIDYGALQDLFGEPITTSATGTPQRAGDVAANMTIITADEIRQSGSRNIAEIIGERVPGMDVLRSSETAYDVGARGYQQPFQPRMLVLVDGRQVFIDDYSRTDWFNIPVNVNDIRQIEVVKGASSALFGSNAVGGVINIITYSPLYDDDNVASISLGTQSHISGDATATIKTANWGGIKLTAGGMNANEFNTLRPDQEATDTVNPLHRYLTESSVFQLTPNLQANTEVTYSESRNVEPEEINNLLSDKTKTYSVRGGLAWQTPYGLISSNNYLNHTNFNITVPGVAPADLITDLIVSQLGDQFRIGSDHTFRIGMEYRDQIFSFQPSVVAAGESEAPRFDQTGYSVDGTWLWQITDRLSWTNAVRFDHKQLAQTGHLAPDAFLTDADYSHDLNAFSANSGLVYEATDMDTFRLTYGRGVQLPSMLEYGFTKLVNPGILLDFEGSPHLKPTIVQDYEFGYNRKLPAILSTATFSAYYELNQDLKAPDQTTFVRGNGFNVIQSINVGNSDGWGGEVALEGKSENGVRWGGSYSLAFVRDSPLASSLLGYNGSTPEHHFRLTGGYTVGAWEFDANAQYLTSTNMFRDQGDGAIQVPTSGYASLNGRIGYNINEHLTVAVSGTNITSAHTQENPYPAIERQVFLTLTGKF
jgi:outer membrane receptor for ferrienterochelin and colicins